MRRELYADPLKDKIFVSIRGNLVYLHLPSNTQREQYDHRREAVSSFTDRSRLRMLKWSATVEWPKIPCALFVTLTYPDEFASVSLGERNAHKEAMVKRIWRHLARQCGVIWRWEWVPRQSGFHLGEYVPHLHMLLLSVRYYFWYDMMEQWQQVLGLNTYVRTDVRKADRKGMAAAYMAKYLAKSKPASVLVNGTYPAVEGRHWGYRFPAGIPRARERIFAGLSPEETWIFIKAAARAMKHFDARFPTSFSLFGKEGLNAVNEFLADPLAKEKEWWYDDPYQGGESPG